MVNLPSVYSERKYTHQLFGIVYILSIHHHPHDILISKEVVDGFLSEVKWKQVGWQSKHNDDAARLCRLHEGHVTTSKALQAR